jgi:hypothetical protein
MIQFPIEIVLSTAALATEFAGGSWQRAMALTGAILGVVIGCSVIGLVIFVLVILCCLRREDDDETNAHPGDSLQTTEQLIPPVFYTAEMKDPLMWPDLGDRIG